MAPNFFGGSNRDVTSVKHFEIRYIVASHNLEVTDPVLTGHNSRLDQSNLTLRGTPDEASSVLLKGTLVLCLSEPLRIQGIRLRFTGEKRLGLA